MKICVTKVDNKLVPKYQSDFDYVHKLKEYNDYMIELKKPRNPKQHKLFFALLKCVLDNQSYYTTIDQLLILTKKKLGLYDIVYTHDSEEIISLKSISFKSMDNIEFEDNVLQPAIEMFAEFLGCSINELTNNYKKYL
jgi:hypothetical protein